MKIHFSKRLAAVLYGAASLLLASLPAAAQSYPNKIIHLIVPFPAGSVVETFSRIIGENMEPTLGQKVLVEARPGAGTVIGTQYVIAQPADGYTVLLASPSLAIKSSVLKAPFDARKDVTAIGQINDSALVLAVNSRIPVKTAKELIDYVKARPGKINMSHYGVGTLGHLMGELLVYRYGLKVVSIPFSGSVQNSLSLAQGNGDFTFDVPVSLRTHVQAGRVTIISTSTPERDAAMPEIPSMTESGVNDFSVSSWSGFVGPAGMPRDVVAKLNAAIGVALKTPAVRAHFERINIGLRKDVSTPEQFGAVIRQTVDDFSKLIRDAKLDVE